MKSSLNKGAGATFHNNRCGEDIYSFTWLRVSQTYWTGFSVSLLHWSLVWVWYIRCSDRCKVPKQILHINRSIHFSSGRTLPLSRSQTLVKRTINFLKDSFPKRSVSPTKKTEGVRISPFAPIITSYFTTLLIFVYDSQMKTVRTQCRLFAIQESYVGQEGLCRVVGQVSVPLTRPNPSRGLTM